MGRKLKIFMRLSRLYIADQLVPETLTELSEQSAHYIRTVLRLKKDQKITLFDGRGGEFLCRLQEVTRKKVIAEVLEFNDHSVESALKVYLGLGISRGDRMDWAVQKAVELGVGRITPLFTDRCVVKLNQEKKKQRLMHWQNIAQHAAEQCGRTVLPTVCDSDVLTRWVTSQQGLKVILDPYATQSLRDLNPENKHITVLSGPEGGFTNDERMIAVEAGFTAVCLGQRILRTETAVLASLSAIQMLWGDFS